VRSSHRYAGFKCAAILGPETRAWSTDSRRWRETSNSLRNFAIAGTCRVLAAWLYLAAQAFRAGRSGCGAT
jgi:hypothetical protein